jgi:hypothetical protein
MSDRYDEAKKKGQAFKASLNPLHWGELTTMPSTLLTYFALWYEEKYLAEALTAAMMKLHEEKPDSPCANVREIVVEYLKDNGYDGLCNPLIQCECFLDNRPGCELMACCEIIGDCRPGVLKDGKIVEREGETFYEGLNKLEKILDEANEKEARGD